MIALARRRTRRTKSASSNSGSSGSRPMCAISVGSSAPPSETSRPPNIRWSTKRISSGPSSVASVNRTRRCRSSGAPGWWSSIWPLMPRWPSSASPGRSSARRASRASQKYLPRRRTASMRRSDQGGDEAVGPRAGRGAAGAGAAPRPRRCGRRSRGAGGRRGRPRPRAAQARAGVRAARRARGGRRSARRTPSWRRPARLPSWSGRCRGRRAPRRPGPGRRRSSCGRGRRPR